tara:strand:- start:1474 stop:2667 length:1194 start_codon:yes stop_codon:yes gene_type:complete
MSIESGTTIKNCIIVIPSRLNSSRFPRKALIKIDGKTLIQRVIEIAKNVKGVDQVVVATDSQEIAEESNKYNVESIITSSDHKNGTERLIEVMQNKKAKYYINLQGDEVIIKPEDIEKALNQLVKSDSEIVTICRPIALKDGLDPSKVKVVVSEKNQAIYFSRSVVPFNQDTLLEHSGVYLFKRSALLKIKDLTTTKLERNENLEQLRWLEAGISINLSYSNCKSISIDTPNDKTKAERLIKIRKIKSIITDVDGVLTDGKIIYNSEGEEHKIFSAQDGSAIKRLQMKGYLISILSGRDSRALRARAQDLGIKNMILGEKDKAIGIKKLQKIINLTEEECAYIGDDIEDIPPMNICGWSFAVANAREEVKSIASQILSKKGGEGVFTEIESILKISI